MKYRESLLDKRLRRKFANDYSHASLKKIFLKDGRLRGLTSVEMGFEYPITAIAGKNGSGKSTVLALACCAYHNKPQGFRLPKRKNSYYTFSDFFIQHGDEVPPDGIEIHYYMAYNNWRKSERMPDGVGLGMQKRQKSKGGKWNDYADRVNRDVIFLGIERIVPHAERSQSRSYSRVFNETPPKGWEDRVKEVVGSVLGRQYDSYRRFNYSKYSLPVVKTARVSYSGFNMGAGENALFEIFSTIYSCGTGALLVIDEIELGLHAEAQRKFIEKLKEVCLETGTQVICTTHSKEIFDSLPYDARYYIESVSGKTRITPSVSSDFAFSKMAAIPGIELDVLVEDDVAKTIIQHCLPASIRSRITLRVIGSATALARQLAAMKVRGEHHPTLAIYDGDQRAQAANNYEHAKNMCEREPPDFRGWYESRIAFLPGETWPEAWLVQKSLECLPQLASAVSEDPEALREIIEYGLQAGKHNEFYEISKNLGLDRDLCLQSFAAVVCANASGEFAEIVSAIERALIAAG